MMKKLREVIKKNRVIVGLLVISIIMPLFVWLGKFCVDGCLVFRRPYEAGWLSFFGSYLGGLLGGVATLIAVVRTIDSNKEEQKTKEENEKRKSIQKSALIVYYDFQFAFDNIKKFMKSYRSACGRLSYLNSLITGSADFIKYSGCIDQFDQFYIDSDWIKTVAGLSDSPLFNSDNGESIKRIYEIYGNLMTVKKSIEVVNDNTCNAAFIAMNNLIDSKKIAREGSKAEIQLKEDIENLLDTLKGLAFM